MTWLMSIVPDMVIQVPYSCTMLYDYHTHIVRLEITEPPVTKQ